MSKRINSAFAVTEHGDYITPCEKEQSSTATKSRSGPIKAKRSFAQITAKAVLSPEGRNA